MCEPIEHGNSYDQGEPVVSYRWTAWVWEITGWSGDCRKITDHFRGIYRIYPNLIKDNWRISTCNRLDLETLGSQPVMSKNLPNPWVTFVNPFFAHMCTPIDLGHWYHLVCQGQFSPLSSTCAYLLDITCTLVATSVVLGSVSPNWGLHLNFRLTRHFYDALSLCEKEET